MFVSSAKHARLQRQKCSSPDQHKTCSSLAMNAFVCSVMSCSEVSSRGYLVVSDQHLRGKLVDHYIELDATTRADLKQLKAALMTKAGLTQDPLTAGKLFISRCQWPGEKAEDFAAELRKLFRRAYPEEDISSDVLLQPFLSGLLAPVSRQMLLRGKTMTFAQATKNATEIEYALIF